MTDNTIETAILTADVVMLAECGGNSHVLLIERGNPPHEGQWALPGGRVNAGEECIDAARRELREETGLIPIRLEEVGFYHAPRRDTRGRYVAVAYLAVLDHRPQPRAGDDARTARWFSLDEVFDAAFGPLAFDHGRIITDAVSYVHRGVLTPTVSTIMVAGGNASVGQQVGVSFGRNPDA